MRRAHAVVLTIAVSVVPVAGGCASTPDPSEISTLDEAIDAGYVQTYPDVLRAELARDGVGTYTLEVTMSSPYDTPERYADGWRVLDEDRNELGSHTLTHDHAEEQPFTRSQTGLTIPADVDLVTVEGRDLQYGYGGAAVTVAVPRSG